MSLTVGTDSFISLADADTYMKSRLHSEGWPVTWDTYPLAVSDLVPVTANPDDPDGLTRPSIDTADPEYLRRLDVKERALKLATAVLCRQSFKGCISSLSQVLSFPRAGSCDREGRALPSNAIPNEISQATAELALFLILTDITNEDTRRRFNIRSESIGESSVTYSASAPALDGLPWIVQELISPYLKTAGSSAPLVQ
jgi:hypothetical protein